MTQEELADKSGLSPRTIQAIERGQVSRPHRESVRLLADALGLNGAARAEFETAARRPAGSHRDCGADPCASLADVAGCLVRHLRTISTDEQHVDLHGLGRSVDPETVLARLLRALGIDSQDIADAGDGYGLAGSLVPDHTLPVHMLPGA